MRVVLMRKSSISNPAERAQECWRFSRGEGTLKSKVLPTSPAFLRVESSVTPSPVLCLFITHPISVTHHIQPNPTADIMTQPPNDSTLFHLIPRNEESREVLHDPNNKRFISNTSSGSNVELGLEVGFHVSSIPGRIMARVGRSAQSDLILSKPYISSVHLAFEMNPATKVVVLTPRARETSSILVQLYDDNDLGPEIQGGCVILYGQSYILRIGSDYLFFLKWRDGNANRLKELAVWGYENAMQQQVHLDPRTLPTEVDSSVQTWYNTRILTAPRMLVRECPKTERLEIGGGSFGKVFRAFDLESGHYFAIKVIYVAKFNSPDQARHAVHTEVKALQKLKHVCCPYCSPARHITTKPGR